MKWKIYRRIFYNASDVNNNILLQRRCYFQLSYVYHTNTHIQWNKMFAGVSEWMMAAAGHSMALPLLAMGKQQIQLAANHRCGEMKLSNKRECARAWFKLLCIGTSPTTQRPDIYRSVQLAARWARTETKLNERCYVSLREFISFFQHIQRKKNRCTWENVWVSGLAVCIFMNIKWCIECFMLYNKLHGGSGFARQCQEKYVARCRRPIVFTLMVIANNRYYNYIPTDEIISIFFLLLSFVFSWFLWLRG